MKFSLGKKTILLIVCIIAAISVLAIVVYDKGIHDVIESQYKARSVDIANVVAVEIDAKKLQNVQEAVCEIYEQCDNKVMSDQWGTPEFDAYIAQYAAIEEMEDFKSLRRDLRRMQDVLDVDCLYSIWVDVENKCYVYLVDAAYEDACPPGCIDPVYLDDIEGFVNNPDLITHPNITNTPEYGWLVATSIPVCNRAGKAFAYASVDISMNDVMALEYRFLTYIALAFLGLTIVACIVGILLVNRLIVKPINTLSQAAAQYEHNKKVFAGLDIKRDDEIGTLADSMAKMEEDIDVYINDLERTTNELISSREHATQMERAANIDPLTKVRNKRAYDIETTRLNDSTEPYGIAMIDLNGLKAINDTYGHEKGDISINNLCQTICQVFKHSPVYRVGGDEFVVILEHSDFEERDSLIQTISDTFRHNLDDTSLEPWERVSAAVGCAVYDPEIDENVDNVLKRADAAMYENKKAMKKAR